MLENIDKYPVRIKEITDLICEKRLDSLPVSNYTDLPVLNIQLGKHSEPKGTVYYSNNMISCAEPATFYLACYCMPKIIDEVLTLSNGRQRTVSHIPDHLVILTLCKALSILAEEAGDVHQCLRYETVLTQLINAYNESMAETSASSLVQGFKLNAYTI